MPNLDKQVPVTKPRYLVPIIETVFNIRPAIIIK
jgi:hypothetical protein